MGTKSSSCKQRTETMSVNLLRMWRLTPPSSFSLKKAGKQHHAGDFTHLHRSINLPFHLPTPCLYYTQHSKFGPNHRVERSKPHTAPQMQGEDPIPRLLGRTQHSAHFTARTRRCCRCSQKMVLLAPGQAIDQCATQSLGLDCSSKMRHANGFIGIALSWSWRPRAAGS